MFGSQNNFILSLYQDSRSVFRLIDIAMLVGETNLGSISKKLNYYVQKGQLGNPRKGIYTKPGFDPEELACRIYSPSYISLEYVLQRSGISFQYDAAITMISYLNRALSIDKKTVRFRKIKQSVLLNMVGIEKKTDFINVASKERAFLDLTYLNQEVYLDNPGLLDKQIVQKIMPIYQSKAMNKRVQEFF
jgi:hypothetical protein